MAATDAMADLLRGANLVWKADMDELPVVLGPIAVTAVLVASLVLLAVLALLGWVGWRRVRRDDRIERGMLGLRAATTPPGPRREVAGLRKTLREHLIQTERMVLAAAPADETLTDMVSQLRRSAQATDARLRLMQGEPDHAYLREIVPELREQVRAVCADASLLRRSAIVAGEHPGEQMARQDLRDRLVGFRAGLDEIRSLDPAPPPGPAQVSAPGGPLGEGGRGDRQLEDGAPSA